MNPTTCLWSASTRLLALVVACATSPCARADVTFYGEIDLAIDYVRKSEGNVQGTLFGSSGGAPAPNSVASPATSTMRVSTSLTRQSHLGVRGTEDFGGGWAAKFALEGGLLPDVGGTGNDGRLFGRLAWLGIATPYGEVRLGRQAAPMLVAYYLNSLERIGTTDLLAAGVSVNNLQNYQDNMVSYGLLKGPWLSRLSYSPNAGVASRVSAARAPVANDLTGQFLGGATAGTETSTRRGEAAGALVSYSASEARVIAAFHYNKFGVPFGLSTSSGYLPLYSMDSFRSFTVGAKYKTIGTGTEMAANFYRGQFKERGDQDPRVSVIGLAAKQPIGVADLIAQFAQGKFDNFTRGKDTGIALGVDYNLSKRTAVYGRYVDVKDDRGNVVPSGGTPRLPLAGGPLNVLLPLGSIEVPILSGAGSGLDVTTRLFALGIRQQF